MITKSNPGTLSLLLVNNAHPESCGIPPVVDAASNYIGYFENAIGQQWLLVGDRANKTAKLYGGDLGWSRIQTLTPQEPKPDVYMSDDEAFWLGSCLAAIFQIPISKLGTRFREWRAGESHE